MIKQYLKQAFAILKENPLISFISITGTALAIAMIMVLVISYEVKTANYSPEGNRNRMLYVKRGNYAREGDDNSSQNSFRLIKEVFYQLTLPEAVTAVSSENEKLISIPAGENEYKADVIYTDERFWQVFNFRFLGGKPFSEADVQSGIKKAVISEPLARGLYGTADVTGKPVLVSYTEYIICGVVPAISMLAEYAYAQVWLPHTTTTFHKRVYSEDTLGEFSCYILARSEKDFDGIRKETGRLMEQFNATLQNGAYRLNGQPDSHFVSMYRRGNKQPDASLIMLRYALILFILLLVPAINLSGITLSGMRKRMPEIGVRKAFGATTVRLLMQILYENLILTVIGGIFGLMVSYLAVTAMSDWLLSTDYVNFRGGTVSVNAEMIVNPVIFMDAFLFCLLLNLLSAAIPAWRVSGKNIVYALNEITD
jgi:putative ABC transport system permease protein